MNSGEPWMPAVGRLEPIETRVKNNKHGFGSKEPKLPKPKVEDDVEKDPKKPKAYSQQLESSRSKLTHLEQELQRARQQMATFVDNEVVGSIIHLLLEEDKAQQA